MMSEAKQCREHSDRTVCLVVCLAIALAPFPHCGSSLSAQIIPPGFKIAFTTLTRSIV